ncbi:helix-turn-helix domain-containing protein [Lysinibacter cavernae]|uniref:PucR family transcriptional regulator n=1 Tax=Lysinibacter cavernae TaxID=1640652 RepID=A0A7X5TTN3_9MICO|nr:helix-turn-helix domain-containing protein [Lysinibacter cavernae]NIH54385.1 hypothetical protein [Lysinibacter cavernae]
MIRPPHSTQLNVAELIANGSLRSTRPLYLTSTSAVVEGVVIVSQPDEIRNVAPHTVVVIPAGIGTSGWLVSSALRQAWERKASAVIVADTPYSSSIVALAKRLDISLLAAIDDPTTVALSLAGELGTAASSMSIRLARFAQAVAAEHTINTVLKAASKELRGAVVSLEFDHIVVASAGSGTVDASTAGHTLVTADLPSVGGGVSGRISTVVLSNGTDAASAQAILSVAAPSVQAAWLAADAAESRGAVPTSALVGLHAIATAPDERASDNEDEPSLDINGAKVNAGGGNPGSRLLSQLGWQSDQRYVAVWIRGEPGAERAPALTSVLRLLWRKVAQRCPLAEVDDGWLAVVPSGYPDSVVQLERNINTRLGGALAELGLTAGLSRWQHSPSRSLTELAHEARLAAQCVPPSGTTRVVAFGQLGVEAAARFVDTDTILQIARLTVPRLLEAADGEHIASALETYYANNGSVVAAAQALGVHRNTIQARLTRARALDVPIDDPSKTLSVHLIVAALRNSGILVSGTVSTATASVGIVPSALQNPPTNSIRTVRAPQTGTAPTTSEDL